MFLTPALLLGRAIGLIIGFTFHEFAHAWTAVRLGDNTPRFQRRLTLDPRSHIDIIGILMALIAGFGWAKPVPINPHAFYPNERRGIMIVSFAGPLTNLVIAFVLSIPLRLILALTDTYSIAQHWYTELPFEILTVAIFFNVVLFFFNLIPLAPLDGWKVMLGLVPPHTARQLQQYEQESTFALMMLIFVGFFIPQLSVIGVVIGPFIRLTFDLFTGLSDPLL